MKKRLTGATFDASAKTVVHADFSDITLAGIQLIVNVTDQIIIYNFADADKGGTLSTDTLTLEHDTTSMSDTDELMILVEDGSATQPVSAASLPLPSGAATSAKQDTIIGHVDGIEGLLTTIDGDTGNISTKIDTLAGAVTGTEMQVDVLTMPTVAVTQSGTWDEVGINDSGNSLTVDAPVGTPVFVRLSDGSSAIATLPVSLASVPSHAVTNAGTFAVQDATVATNTGNAATSLGVMDDWDNAASDGASVSGDVAHDVADAGEPVKMGMKAVALKANPTEVAAGDRTNWYADVSGVPFVLGGHPNVLTQSIQVTDADGAQTDTAIITAAANVAVVVTKVSVMADNANTGDVSVRIGFGTANTPSVDAAQVLLFHPGIAPGSGVVEGNGAGIIGIGASNEDVRITCEDPAGGSINAIVTYFTTEIA
jgi:hypothetical protein